MYGILPAPRVFLNPLLGYVGNESRISCDKPKWAPHMVDIRDTGIWGGTVESSSYVGRVADEKCAGSRLIGDMYIEFFPFLVYSQAHCAGSWSINQGYRAMSPNEFLTPGTLGTGSRGGTHDGSHCTRDPRTCPPRE